jgi:hypothetical protein
MREKSMHLAAYSFGSTYKNTSYSYLYCYCSGNIIFEEYQIDTKIARKVG